MKKRSLSFLLIMCTLVLGVMSFTACNGEPTSATPPKLSAPVITLTENIASWAADANADRFEISLDGNLSYVENTVTSKTLTNGQTLKVRAVGDGTSYSTSDWSNSVTYITGTPSSTVTPATTTAPTTTTTPATVPAVTTIRSTTPSTATPPTPTEAPTYLGIFASSTEPSSNGGLPEGFAIRPVMASYGMMEGGDYRVFNDALNEHFQNSSNHLNDNFPKASDYKVYAKSGETVYIQIWLNNPSQHTILSLKLNGTKYQVGGGLSSFFIEEGSQHYNCIYVAITIPSDTYTEKTYTVTDIEYIADTYINADGTDEFMNNNDTVSIGLPYQAAKPSVSDFNTASLTVNAVSASFHLTDASLADVSGGWLGVAVYDGHNIVANQSTASGNNTVNATKLVENTTYWITVYLYADLHDGKGVAAHILFEKTVRTPEAITVEEIDGALLYDTQKDGYYGAIKVNTILNSTTAEYIKLEIIAEDEQVVYTDTSFNGTATVSQGILCGNSYAVRVYYKDTEYPNGKYVEEHAWVDNLGTPWYQEAGVYSFVNDAVYYFQLNNNDENYPAIDSLVVKLYDEESARWVASDVLYLLDNPTAIEDLNAQIDALREKFNAAYGNFELMDEIHNELSALEERRAPLDKAKWYLDYRADESCDRAYWEAEAAKGKYYYIIEYNGTDTEKAFKIGKTYYMVLEGALKLDGGNQYRNLRVDIDYKTVNGATDTARDGVSIENHFICNLLELRNIEINGNTMTFSLVNIDDYMLPNGGESILEKGFLYKIVAHPGTIDETVIYLNESNPDLNVDEAAWFAEYIRRIKTGESVDGLYAQYIPEYKDFYSITIDSSKINAGLTSLIIYTRFMAKDYAVGEYEDDVYTHLILSKQLDTPTVVFDADGGRGTAESGWDNGYEYEAKDKNGNPVQLDMIDSHRFALPAVGTMIRAKRLGSDYWLESEWSEWFTFEGIKLPAPEFGEYDPSRCKMGWSVWDTSNISHYVYTINGGTAVTVALDGNCSVFLKNGDVLRVKSVPNAEGIAKGYIDGEWAEYTCVDNRSVLSVPTNLRIADKVLWWDAVDRAMYYVVEITYEGKTTERIVRSNNMAPPMPGRTYRVRALAEDQENHRSSGWSESITYNQ